MVLCKYFLEGYCRFGTSCKYEHPYSYGGYDSSAGTDFSTAERPSGKSILKGTNSSFTNQEFQQISNEPLQSVNYQQNANIPSSLRYNVHEMMHIVLKDIVTSESGSQWQLSAYSPYKDLPNIPGLVDHSPEELRWECYKALQSGSLSLYQAIVQQLYMIVAKTNNELKKKDTGYSIINGWLRSVEAKLNTDMTSSFGNSNVAVGLSTSEQFNPRNDMETASSSSFAFTLPQQQQTVLQASNSVFTSSQPAIPPTSNQNFQSISSSSVVVNISDSEAYSLVEDLTEKELGSFKEDKFVLGAIPTKPPPKMFCNV